MDRKSSRLSLLLILLFPLACSFQLRAQGPVKITPVDTPLTEFGPIGFRVSAEWMDGYLEMRFPETLDCEEGMFFIDHYRPDMIPFSRVKKYPEWKTDPVSGTITYSYITDEGLEFGGIASPAGDEVHLEFYAKNKTGKKLVNMSPQVCLMLDKSGDYNELKKLSDVYIISGGKWFPLDKATPTPEEKGRDPKLVIGKKGFVNMQAVGKTVIPLPGNDVGEWWIINEESDEDIIYRTSKDGKHLAAVAWPGDVSFLIYNSMNPCIHAGPSIQYTIEPGMERHWYGTIWLSENNPEGLLKKYKNGQRPQ